MSTAAVAEGDYIYIYMYYVYFGKIELTKNQQTSQKGAR